MAIKIKIHLRASFVSVSRQVRGLSPLPLSSFAAIGRTKRDVTKDNLPNDVTTWTTLAKWTKVRSNVGEIRRNLGRWVGKRVGCCAPSIPKASVQWIDLPFLRYFRPLLTIKRCRMSLFGSTRIEISARCHSEKTLPSGLPWTVPYPTLRPTGPIPKQAEYL